MGSVKLEDLVRRKLNITWSDENTDDRLRQIIEDAQVELIGKIGITQDNFDFSVASQERKLLLAYCFYEWNHALDEFDVNYAADILQARERWEVKSHAQGQTSGL